jgi:SPP1 family predicted phage head-tail adaptor
MKAGDLRERVTIQAKTVTFNAYNEPIETWSDLVTVCAAFPDQNGKEMRAAQKLYSSVTAVIVIRYRSDITVLHRVLHGSRVYEIQAVIDENMRHHWLQLHLCEVV